MKTDEKALKRIVSRLEKAWQEDAAKAIERLYELLEGGKKVDVAVDQLRKEFPGLFTLPDVKSAMVEAAAYGYGIVPSMLTAAQLKSWEKALSESWNADGMKLSKRLHGTDTKMRNAIIDTIREQMKRNATWTASARALYDGYNADKVVRVQELPEYLKAVRRATQGSPEMLSAARKAVNNINRLAQKGAPTKALKTAYADMVKAATLGTQEQLQKAIWVAIQEKSRYVADRIIRTETARAWADGFIAKIMDDDDVVAVRWKLSTRHPVFDICDMYARADMYKLGAGIYPKDKLPPLPAHPHCLCGMVEVFVGEVDLAKKKNNIREAGNEWLKGLSVVQRRRVLGIVGEAQWSTGKDWRKFMNGWQGLNEPSTRLNELVTEPQGRGRKTNITQKTIDNLGVVNFPGFTSRENALLQQRYRELLAYSKDYNDSNEVAFILSSDLKSKLIEKGNAQEVVFSKAAKNKMLTEKNVCILHNHPKGYGFSFDDLHVFEEYPNVKVISLITNSGRVEVLRKTDKYDILEVSKSTYRALEKFEANSGVNKHEAMEAILNNLVKDGLIIWKK